VLDVLCRIGGIESASPAGVRLHRQRADDAVDRADGGAGAVVDVAVAVVSPRDHAITDTELAVGERALLPLELEVCAGIAGTSVQAGGWFAAIVRAPRATFEISD
jgi:hypothetical protein